MKADPQIEREVKQTLEGLMDAYGKGDVNRAMTFVAKDDDITLIEPGADQLYVGQDQVRKTIQFDFETTEGDIPVTFKRTWVSSNNSDVAWVNGELEVNVNYKGQDMALPGRITGVLTRSDGRWLVHTIHVGAPTIGIEQPTGEQWPTQAARVEGR